MHIILLHPRIPQNAGAIARLAAATHSRLTLVRPLGFRTDQATVRRAGLDYWEQAEVAVADHLDEAIEQCTGDVYYLSRYGQRTIWEAEYSPETAFVFGSEDEGLPEEIKSDVPPDHILRIPISNPHVRSLNLATSVAIVIYEALRQRNT